MRRGALVLAGLVALILVVGSLPAAAYVDVGYDPDEPALTDSDVHATVRRVEHTEHGPLLIVAIRLYPGGLPLNHLAVNPSWEFVFRLDSRGGRAADAVVRLWYADMNPSGCALETRSGRFLRKGSLSSSTRRARCRVPIHRLHARGRAIRWKAMSMGGGDVAPDVGMYG